jgi:hypothetical protein
MCWDYCTQDFAFWLFTNYGGIAEGCGFNTATFGCELPYSLEPPTSAGCECQCERIIYPG